MVEQAGRQDPALAFSTTELQNKSWHLKGLQRSQQTEQGTELGTRMPLCSHHVHHGAVCTSLTHREEDMPWLPRVDISHMHGGIHLQPYILP